MDSEIVSAPRSSTFFSHNHPTIFLRVGVTYKTGFGLDDWIYCILYIYTVRDYRQNGAITILHTFQFTVAHIPGFSAFTSRILATDLSESLKLITHQIFLSQSNFFLAISSQSLSAAISRTRPISRQLTQMNSSST
jgi:hypothetical protein